MRSCASLPAKIDHASLGFLRQRGRQAHGQEQGSPSGTTAPASLSRQISALPPRSMWSSSKLASCGLALMLRNQDHRQAAGANHELHGAFRLPVNQAAFLLLLIPPPSASLSFFHTSHKYHPFLHRCPTLFLSSSPSIETFTCLISQHLLSTSFTSNHEILRSAFFILFTRSCLTASPSTTAFLQYGLESPTLLLPFHQRRPTITLNILLVESHAYKRNPYLSCWSKTFTRRGRVEPRR